MARKSVKNFSVNVTNNAVVVEIHTENIKPYKYQIFPDDVQGNIQGIAAHLQAGLEEAQRTLQKIEVSEFFERNYVTIVTPVKRVSNRYTAIKL
ncbi:hypothetical protein Q7C15_00880 [Aeromonas salmonicida]|uniref:hypothetical protein n=1 Tax=Aeromonas salmonicida TaxID=645 RepID=UPI0030CF364A